MELCIMLAQASVSLHRELELKHQQLAYWHSSNHFFFYASAQLQSSMQEKMQILHIIKSP